MTPATIIEVADFRREEQSEEMAGLLDPKKSSEFFVIILFRKMTFLYTWAIGLFIDHNDCSLIFAEVSFRVTY